MLSRGRTVAEDEAAHSLRRRAQLALDHHDPHQDPHTPSASPTPRVPRLWHPHANSEDIVIILAHYKEDTSWTARQPYDYVVKSQCCLELGADLNDWNTQLGFQRGTETTAYLSFIIENYDQLPKHMVFMHAHDVGWHQIVSRGVVTMQSLDGLWQRRRCISSLCSIPVLRMGATTVIMIYA